MDRTCQIVGSHSNYLREIFQSFINCFLGRDPQLYDFDYIGPRLLTSEYDGVHFEATFGNFDYLLTEDSSDNSVFNTCCDADEETVSTDNSSFSPIIEHKAINNTKCHFSYNPCTDKWTCEKVNVDTMYDSDCEPSRANKCSNLMEFSSEDDYEADDDNSETYSHTKHTIDDQIKINSSFDTDSKAVKLSVDGDANIQNVAIDEAKIENEMKNTNITDTGQLCFRLEFEDDSIQREIRKFIPHNDSLDFRSIDFLSKFDDTQHSDEEDTEKHSESEAIKQESMQHSEKEEQIDRKIDTQCERNKECVTDINMEVSNSSNSELKGAETTKLVTNASNHATNIEISENVDNDSMNQERDKAKSKSIGILKEITKASQCFLNREYQKAETICTQIMQTLKQKTSKENTLKSMRVLKLLSKCYIVTVQHSKYLETLELLLQYMSDYYGPEHGVLLVPLSSLIKYYEITNREDKKQECIKKQSLIRQKIKCNK